MRCGFFAIVAWLVSAHAVLAAQDDPDTEIARRHFEKASRFYTDHDYESALKEFEAAQAVKALPAFDFNIGRCLDRLEEFARAVAAYERYLASLPAVKDGAQLRERIAVLRQRVALQEAAKARAPSAATGGAGAPSTKLPRYAPADDAVFEPSFDATEHGLPPAARATKGRGRPLLYAGLALVGVGVVAAVVGGAGFGVAAQGEGQAIAGEAGQPYDPTHNDRGNLYQALSFASIGVGGAVALVGGALLIAHLRSADAPPEKPSALRVSPLLGPQLAGAAVAGRF